MCDTKSNQGVPAEQQHSLIVRVVSSVLEKLIYGHVDSPRRSSCGGGFLKFQSSYAPDVTIEAYLDRIRRYSRCSDACFVMALVYVDRLIETRNLVLTKLNAHRLLITSVMVAAKFHDDLFYNNAYYSKLGGLSLTELNHLEAELLQQLDFSLFVHESAYGKYSAQLQNYVFYLEVPATPHLLAARSEAPVPIPVPRPASPVPSAAYGYAGVVCHGAAYAGAAAHPPRPPMVPPIPLALVQNSAQHTSAYGGYDGRSAPAGWVHIPSPDNAHAKACTFSDYYLTAGSPLRIAPPRQPSATTAFQQQHQHLQAQVQASLARHQQQQHQQYVASYAAAEVETEMQLQSMSPMVYPTPSIDPSLARSLSSGYFPSYHAGGSVRDSCDDSTATTCSTRTTSPYPNSANTASTMSAAYARSVSAGALGCVAAIQAQGTSGLTLYGGHSYPGGEGSSRVCTTPPGSSYRRSGLSIQTDSAMESGYPLYRSDSNVSAGSVTTPHALYEQPALQRQVTQATYPSHRQQASQYSYAPEDHRSQLYASTAASQQQYGAGYFGHSQSPMGYGGLYASAQPSPSLYSQEAQQHLQQRYIQQQQQLQQDEEALSARYGTSAGAPYHAGGWQQRGYASGGGTPQQQPQHAARVVTPQPTPSQAAQQSYHLQRQQGLTRVGGGDQWGCPASVPPCGQRYHQGGTLLSAGVV